MKPTIEEAIALRVSGKPEEALEILLRLLSSNSHDAKIHYQIAWTYDSLGKESDAVGYYEQALKNNLQDDRAGAFLGLGSTYRCLGQYEKSLQTFDEALAEFPNDKAFNTFRALTLYNLGKYKESVSDLLVLLLDTSNNADIKKYEKALRFYSDKLDETWVN